MKLLDVLPYYFNVKVKDQHGAKQPAKLLMERREEKFIKKYSESWSIYNHYFIGLQIGDLKSYSWQENNFIMPNGEIYTLL